MKKALIFILGILIAVSFACNPPTGDKEKAEQKREADSTSDALADQLNKQIADSNFTATDSSTAKKTDPKKK
ncbi:MAG: hypothetical protein V2A54_12610 [Bacteroidota bacterium]